MRQVYDLEPRLLQFAADACRIAEQLPATRIGDHIGRQLIRCATSPSANYAEARASESRRDFVHKLKICLKELREALAWLRLVGSLKLLPSPQVDAIVKEADELVSIVFVSVRTAKRNATNVECQQ